MLARRFAPSCFHVIIFLPIDQPANNNFGPELSTPLLRRVLRNLAAFFRNFPAIQAKLRDIFAHDTPQIQPQKSAKVHENVPVYPAEGLHPPNLTNY